MSIPFVLDESAMQSLEARIPELAEIAVRRAYYQALTSSGKVLEAIDGELVETSISGERRVVGILPPPIPVQRGLKLSRRLSR